jgi:hypothetical protein
MGFDTGLAIGLGAVGLGAGSDFLGAGSMAGLGASGRVLGGGNIFIGLSLFDGAGFGAGFGSGWMGRAERLLAGG